MTERSIPETLESSKKFKILHDRPTCIGCGSCAAVDPERWEMNEDGYADLKNCKKDKDWELKEYDEIKDSMDAAECCPVNCIHVYEDEEKKI